jgi:hypothetical protein
VRVVGEFGFRGLGPSAQDFLEPDTVIQLGRPPNRIDLFTAIDGVAFEQAWAGRVEARLDGVPVAFLGKADLIANQRASGRPQDLADLAQLEAS